MQKLKNNNILYCFVSHQPAILNDVITISNNMKLLNYENYIIVYGGQNLSIDHPKVINLETTDDYCSLPEKINKAYKYISLLSDLDFDFVCKLDRTMSIHKLLDDNLLTPYCGKIMKYNNIRYHIGRCTENIKWNNKEFLYDNIPYAIGGVSYVLSKDNIKYIAKDDNEYKLHVYEDVYVGSLMLKKHISVQSFRFEINDYFFDANHPAYFQKNSSNS